MVESGNRPINPLLEQVVKRRKADEERKLSEEQAVAMLPELKKQLGELITAKVPLPQIEKTTNPNAWFSRVEDDLFGNPKRNKFKTKLTAGVPLGDGTVTSVIIRASSYPQAKDPNSAQKLNYVIDVEELNSTLTITTSEAIVASKEWKSRPFTRDTPIGPSPSLPAWERKATKKDIEHYLTLLKSLNQEGITFEGSTPPIVKSQPILKKN